jgi:heme exporter protein A
LLRLLAGLLRPAAGTLLWNGQDVLNDLPTHARQVAYIGHQDAVKPGLTAAENLRFAAALSGGDVAAALASVGLRELADLPVRMLSAGQRRRLALARLALSPAPLWLLDEPTLGLDAASVERFGTMLERHRKSGGVMVAATHLPLPLRGGVELELGQQGAAEITTKPPPPLAGGGQGEGAPSPSPSPSPPSPPPSP